MYKSGMLSVILGLVVVCGVTGCSTVTVRPEGSRKLYTTPTYSVSEDFYFWGLMPEYRAVNLDKICDGRRVIQFQAQDTFTDSVLTIVTLGIYRPRSIRVWCE